ncbi:hypothetical protein KM92DES2_12858 [uncultured Desulfovibrio sp.]|uniref:Uncharacterized protein n=1 Tax=uncultured Desulfovibrio sp. TaxID=167968 RepID=A0A212KE40_9BACT|nr:hypothetical protein KM92DES2_12858 [uncultured Desulfovibrio sp.]
MQITKKSLCDVCSVRRRREAEILGPSNRITRTVLAQSAQLLRLSSVFRYLHHSDT